MYGWIQIDANRKMDGLIDANTGKTFCLGENLVTVYFILGQGFKNSKG